jgi:ATP-dependent Clp protease ATP-binding subunit ClpC
MEYFTEKAKYLREIKFKGFENNPAQIKKLEQEKKAQKIKLEEASQQIMQNAVYENVPYVPWVFSNDVEKVISEWTGIPVSRVSKDESSRLLQIETELQKRVIGQRDAVEAIAKAIRRSRMGLRDLNRPIASLFFSGPTGVGKTEVTKALAASYFGGESDMVRFDMSEFQERHTTAKLIGSPPGYIGYNEGGQLTEAVRRKPYIVVLFDEVEKAHPDVFNVLLQVLDDGRLSDSQGRVCDFKNTIVIMTSNLGSSAIQDKFKELEKDTDPDNFNLDNDLDEQGNEKTANEQMKEFVLDELKSFFRPEFLNRIDEIVVFNTLRKNDIRKIASIMLKKLKQRLATKQYYLLFGETILDAVVDEGYDPTYGARPLRRVITNRIEDKVAAAILENGISPNSTIWVTYVSNEYRIYHNEPSFDKFSEKSYS